MSTLSGQMAFALVMAVLVAAGVAWLVAGLYRRRMVALMRGGAATGEPGANAGSALAWPAVSAPSGLGANRRATLRSLAALTALCLLVAMTRSWLALTVQFEAFSPARLLVLGAVYGWPMVLAWGLTLRWPWRRTVAGTFAYIVLMIGLVMLRSNEQQSALQVTGWLFGEVGFPLVVTLVIGASGRIRAVAPYLLPFTLLLCVASLLALEGLDRDLAGSRTVVTPLVTLFGAKGAMLVAVVAPWLVLVWPAAALGRALARGYRAKLFSDLAYLFAAYWFVIVVANAAPAVAGVGVAGFALLLPWLWIPAALVLLPRRHVPAAASRLLVLRVFQRDAEVERLFDQVIERWRFSGNTLLIAGTDLVSRTLDPDDLFTFLDGRLGQRFIDSEANIAKRLAEFDLAPDPDGRYRVNECYCRDTTWEAALKALVQRSDVVLMDLRGFQAHNRGCRFELDVLSGAQSLRRIVVLYDGRTDRPTAESHIGAAAAGRFRWLDAGRMDTAKARQVLGELLDIEG